MKHKGMEHEDMMKIDLIHINNFRGFKNVTIHIGSKLTCISGRNGVGKSQILALLGNCGELPAKRYKTLQNKQFRADWGQIVQGDLNYDLLSPQKNALNISFSHLPDNKIVVKEVDKYTQNLSFRVFWQSEEIPENEAKNKLNSMPEKQKETKTIRNVINKIEKNKNAHDSTAKIKFPNRFRIVPEKNAERKSEAKLVWPTYYLGLSRLYPIGESTKVKVEKNNKLNNEYLDFFKDAYNYIFSSQEEIIGLDNTKIADIRRKNGLGIESTYYGALGNSSGQDNLNQILSCLASFKNLKKEMKDKYCGGLLLIDELDATLHPSAQNNLIDFLYKQAGDLDIQIVFTTHSLNLINHFTDLNKKRNDKSYQLCYLRKLGDTLEITENPSFTWINKELTLSSASNLPRHKIAIFTEDKTANWFLQQIIDEYNLSSMSINYLDISAGWHELIKLVSSDFDYFSNSILILDPDVSKEDGKKELDKYDSLFTYSPNENVNDISLTSILSFPTFPDIESSYFEGIIWEYFNSLQPDDNFYLLPEVKKLAFSQYTLINNSPFKKYSEGNDQSKIKAWFKDNRSTIKLLMPQFIRQHNREFDTFVAKLVKKYNLIIDSSYPQEKNVTFQKLKDVINN